MEGQDYAAFAHRIDYTWLELWHHEGRRARHGASIMAPDYTRWHGNYEQAKASMAGKLNELLVEVFNSPNYHCR